MAQALAVAAPGRAREVITAFVSGADAGLRVIGISVLVLGGLVVLQSLAVRRLRGGRARQPENDAGLGPC